MRRGELGKMVWYLVILAVLIWDCVFISIALLDG